MYAKSTSSSADALYAYHINTLRRLKLMSIEEFLLSVIASLIAAAIFELIKWLLDK